MKKLLLGLTFIALSATPSHAGPFDFIDRAFNLFDKGNDLVDRGNSSIKRLCRSLGVKDCNINGKDKNDPVGSAMSVYKKWHNTLNDQEKDIVQFLVFESAQGNVTSFKDFSNSKWSLSKPPQERAKAAFIYMNLEKITKEAANDTSRFYAFAFCVNSGRTQCQ